MAPLPPPFVDSHLTSRSLLPKIHDLDLSSLELDRRSSLHSRAIPPPPPGPPNPGTINPFAVNNKGVLALFGLLSAGLVVTSIWFFFWAKNGGFVFREGDWDDYKSTVLRRKDKNGKTLSNATRSTDLGGESLNGEYDRGDDGVGIRGGGRGDIRRPARDNDMREYRHERPARVGGLNRKADGAALPKPKPQMVETPKKHSRSLFHRADKPKPARAYSFRHDDDDDSYTEVSSVPASTPPPKRHGAHRAVPTSSPSSPRHHSRRYEPSETAYTGSSYDDGDLGASGTKSYRHVIPGLGSAAGGSGGKAMTESSFERGERRGREGYRRGNEGRGRRDSLSDSD